MGLVKGLRPDLTPAVVIGLLIAGLPILSNLLRVYGVLDLSREQEDALAETLKWAAVVAGALFISDAGLRAARNSADAKTQAAAMTAEQTALPLTDPDVTAVPEAGLPDDAEEFGGPRAAPTA